MPPGRGCFHRLVRLWSPRRWSSGTGPIRTPAAASAFHRRGVVGLRGKHELDLAAVVRRTGHHGARATVNNLLPHDRFSGIEERAAGPIPRSEDPARQLERICSHGQATLADLEVRHPTRGIPELQPHIRLERDRLPDGRSPRRIPEKAEAGGHFDQQQHEAQREQHDDDPGGKDVQRQVHEEKDEGENGHGDLARRAPRVEWRVEEPAALDRCIE